MFSPITSYDELGPVFTFGADSIGVWLSFILAVVLFVAFFVRMVQHENHAYRSIIEQQPIEKGPAAEGEPPAF